MAGEPYRVCVYRASLQLPIWREFWLELADVGYAEILAGTVWDTPGVF